MHGKEDTKSARERERESNEIRKSARTRRKHRKKMKKRESGIGSNAMQSINCILTPAASTRARECTAVGGTPEPLYVAGTPRLALPSPPETAASGCGSRIIS